MKNGAQCAPFFCLTETEMNSTFPATTPTLLALTHHNSTLPHSDSILALTHVVLS
ncbi:hypothetical protein yaldo0001_35030 [Yersinia aldovae ATCC 35236]|nr:hypothetical protein yaldo0001_35030 [Yersinia aldovae ATCC 35236]